jgi:hypothetical protein
MPIVPNMGRGIGAARAIACAERSRAGGQVSRCGIFAFREQEGRESTWMSKGYALSNSPRAGAGACGGSSLEIPSFPRSLCCQVSSKIREGWGDEIIGKEYSICLLLGACSTVCGIWRISIGGACERRGIRRV